MGNIFSGSEVIELGIQIEKNGRDFYRTLSRQAKNFKTGEIFKFLAAEEEKHIVVFQKILDFVQKYEPAGSYPEEYFAYLSALASEHVFTQKDKGEGIAKKIKTDKEAIEMAISFEKDSIIFYEGMKKVVPQNEHQSIDSLIAQEQGHLRQLSELKTAM